MVTNLQPTKNDMKKTAKQIQSEAKERRIIVHRLRKDGLSFVKIAKQIKVTPPTARMMFLKEENDAKRKLNSHWTDGLSVRVKNVIANCRIESREHAVHEYQSGIFSQRGRSARCFGRKSRRELGEFLGLPFDEPKAMERKACPHCGKKI